MEITSKAQAIESLEQGHDDEIVFPMVPFGLLVSYAKYNEIFWHFIVNQRLYFIVVDILGNIQNR